MNCHDVHDVSQALRKKNQVHAVKRSKFVLAYQIRERLCLLWYQQFQQSLSLSLEA